MGNITACAVSMKKTVENQGPEGSEPLKKLLWGGAVSGQHWPVFCCFVFVFLGGGGGGGVFSGQLWSGNIVFVGGGGGGGGGFSGQHLT